MGSLSMSLLNSMCSNSFQHNSGLQSSRFIHLAPPRSFPILGFRTACASPFALIVSRLPVLSISFKHPRSSACSSSCALSSRPYSSTSCQINVPSVNRTLTVDGPYLQYTLALLQITHRFRFRDLGSKAEIAAIGFKNRRGLCNTRLPLVFEMS